jgi:hypothetical protein
MLLYYGYLLIFQVVEIFKAELNFKSEKDAEGLTVAYA